MSSSDPVLSDSASPAAQVGPPSLGSRRPLPESHAYGRWAEAEAEALLRERGYTVIQRNFRVQGGEIDRICTDVDGTLVFVEVRARDNDDRGHPLETLTDPKRRRIVHAAREYLHRLDGPWPPSMRFDVVAILGKPGEAQVSLLQDAFDTSSSGSTWG